MSLFQTYAEGFLIHHSTKGSLSNAAGISYGILLNNTIVSFFVPFENIEPSVRLAVEITQRSNFNP